MADVNHIPFIHKNFCHDGIWYPNIVLPSSLEVLKTFELRHEDVFVLTFPKSGTHWMLEIIGLILNDGYPDRIDRTLYSSTLEMINMDQAFPKSVEDDIENPMDMTPFLNVADAAPSPRAMMTHLRLERLPKNLFKKTKAVYLARNPKDVTTSWFNFVGHSEFNPITWEDNLKEFIEGKMHWGPWEQHVTEFWKKSKDEDNLLFLFYEDLLRNPTENIRRISEHIDRPLSEEAIHRVVMECSMTSMKETYQKMAQSGKQSFTKASGEYPFLNKGVCGAWKDRFTVAQNEMFNTWYQDKIGDMPLKFSFD